MSADDEVCRVTSIACRFVPYDQWLVTKIDNSWKVKQLKQYLLAKCIAYSSYVRAQAPEPPNARPLSPITFASMLSSPIDKSNLNSTVAPWDHVHDIDADLSFEDSRVDIGKRSGDYLSPYSMGGAYRSESITQASASSASEDITFDLPHHHSKYCLMAFSTGNLLEDDYIVSWYRLRPFELLELHSAGAIVSFDRGTPIAKYIEPYFECKVRTLRVIVKEFISASLDKDRESYAGTENRRREKDGNSTRHRSKRQMASGSSGQNSHHSVSDSSITLAPERGKRKFEWQDRWIIIRQGMLQLCKDRFGHGQNQIFTLSSLRALRGADHLPSSVASMSKEKDPFHPPGQPESTQHIVCAKFRSFTTSSPKPNAHSRPNVDARVDAHTSPKLSGIGLYSDESEDDFSDRTSPREQTDHDRGGEKSGDKGHESGTWVVLDMIDDCAYSGILRILHRHAPLSVSSSFLVPPPSPTHPSHIRPLYDSTSTSSYDCDTSGVPYPEWRKALVKRARRAGMGLVGSPLGWALCGMEEEYLPLVSERTTKEHKKETSQGSGRLSIGDNWSDGGDEGSEKEWEGWMDDLERQKETKLREEVYQRERKVTFGSGNAAGAQSWEGTIPMEPTASSSTIKADGSSSYDTYSSPLSKSYVQQPVIVKTTTRTTVSVGGRNRSASLNEEARSTRGRKGDGKSKLSLPFSTSRGSSSTNVKGASNNGNGSGKNKHEDEETGAPKRGILRHASSTSGLGSCYGLAGGDEDSPSVVLPAHDTTTTILPRSAGARGSSNKAPKRGMSLRVPGQDKLARGLDSAMDFLEGK